MVYVAFQGFLIPSLLFPLSPRIDDCPFEVTLSCTPATQYSVIMLPKELDPNTDSLGAPAKLAYDYCD